MEVVSLDLLPCERSELLMQKLKLEAVLERERHERLCERLNLEAQLKVSTREAEAQGKAEGEAAALLRMEELMSRAVRQALTEPMREIASLKKTLNEQCVMANRAELVYKDEGEEYHNNSSSSGTSTPVFAMTFKKSISLTWYLGCFVFFRLIDSVFK